MNDEKEVYIGPVEQVINSMMEIAGDEIMDLTHNPGGINVKETV